MDYIKLFILSMVPIIELRGAVPLGIATDRVFSVRRFFWES